MSDISTRKHRFKIGDTVRLNASNRDQGAPSGMYKVTRLLPAEGQDFQYRVRDSREGREHVVRESALT